MLRNIFLGVMTIGIIVMILIGQYLISIGFTLILLADILSNKNRDNHNYVKMDKEKKCIYNFELVAKIPKELNGESKGVSVEGWFVEANDKYNILNQIDIDFDYCEEEFIVEVRIEDGDAFHKEYLYEHIKSVLRKFENDFNTKWEG